MVSAAEKLGINKPVIVRLQGTNMDEARNILKKSGLSFTMENDLDEAAKKVVKSIK